MKSKFSILALAAAVAMTMTSCFSIPGLGNAQAYNNAYSNHALRGNVNANLWPYQSNSYNARPVASPRYTGAYYTNQPLNGNVYGNYAPQGYRAPRHSATVMPRGFTATSGGPVASPRYNGPYYSNGPLTGNVR